MNYREDKYGNKLSILGFGCMRFQRKLGNIDFEKAEHQIMLAIESGVNYFDTAYIYPGSEALLGEVLEKNHVRDKVYIATKIPHYLIKSVKDMDRIFAEELRRQGLSDCKSDFLPDHSPHLMARIRGPELRRTHFMED